MRHLEAHEIVAGDRRIGAVYQESEAPVFRCGLQLCWSPTQGSGDGPRESLRSYTKPATNGRGGAG